MRTKLHVALAIVSVCFGGFSVVGKVALADPAVSPFALTALRLSGAAVVFLLTASLRREPWPPRALLLPFAGLALLGTVLNQALFLTGLQHTTAVEATLLVGSIPLFTYALGWRLGREPSKPNRWAGLAVALAGVGTLLVTRGARLETSHLVGNLLILGNCFSYSLYLVLAKPLLETQPSVRSMGVLFLLGALLFAPLGGRELLAMPWSTLSTTTLLSLAYAVVFPTVVAYFLNLWALKRAPASLVAIYVLAQPLIAAVLAALPPLRERPTPTLFAAGLLIVGGVGLFSRD